MRGERTSPGYEATRFRFAGTSPKARDRAITRAARVRSTPHESQKIFKNADRRGRARRRRHGEPRRLATGGGAHVALRAASRSRQFRSDLEHAVRGAQWGGAGVGHALWHERPAQAAAPDGGGRGTIGRSPDLDL